MGAFLSINIHKMLALKVAIIFLVDKRYRLSEDLRILRYMVCWNIKTLDMYEYLSML